MKWIVVSHPDFGMSDCAIVEADDEAKAATEGMWTLWEESPDNPPSSVIAVPITAEAKFWRADLTAERVPEEFQCCGGMPNDAVMGTGDAHTAVCPNYVREDPDAS